MKHRLFLLALLLAAGAGTVIAQEAPETGWRAEYLAELADQQEKVLALAESLPADLFTWRPGEGVRSFSETFMHIAAANFNLPRLLGTPPPEGFDVRTFERSTTDRAEIAAHLRASFEHVRNAVLAMDDGAADEAFDWFSGRKNTRRGLLLFMAKHTAEHQGQLIAYTRVNGRVPPWSQGGD